MSHLLRCGFIALGVALLAGLLWHTDLAEVGARIKQLGIVGAGCVLAVYALAFLLDTAVWMATLVTRSMGVAWLFRLWEIRVVGEAVNSATPLGSVGGEPVKALMLRKYYGVGLREGASSLVLAKTAILVGLVVFLATGFALTLGSQRLPPTMKLVAGLGLGAFGLAIMGLILFQWFRLATVAGGWLRRSRHGERMKRWLDAIHDMDERFVTFYTHHVDRFGPAVLFSIGNWFLGAVELMVVMEFLGQPIAFADAIMVESLAQLVRAGTFFIPMSLGAQDGTFMLALGAMTGAPALGLAVALIRRGRELLWILLGLLLFWTFSGRPAHPGAPESA
ncbi:MAG: flippase-like domain-containing protein [Alphaproteobacteria bacterium]|nr:flippase-like domain-containing protein [Alphaproteobacteria bacterium]